LHTLRTTCSQQNSEQIQYIIHKISYSFFPIFKIYLQNLTHITLYNNLQGHLLKIACSSILQSKGSEGLVGHCKDGARIILTPIKRMFFFRHFVNTRRTVYYIVWQLYNCVCTSSHLILHPWSKRNNK